MLQTFSGATIKRVVDRSGAQVPEHAHDWPVLSIFVIGAYENRTELGRNFIDGPSAVLYRAGAAHQNTAAPSGFEQVEIEFDPAWLGCVRLPDAPVTQWLGGSAGKEARQLARICNSRQVSERQVRAAVRQFVERARNAPGLQVPAWVGTVARRVRGDTTVSIGDLARGVNRHPSWLGTAYRRAAGEGLLEMAARIRSEHAARLLRETDEAAASVAITAGFCDQSHMIRTFRRLLGRSPSAVRDDRRYFR